MEHPSVDHNYPVLVVASFAKNQYICLKIEADALQVRKVEQVMSTLGTAVPEQVDFDIPELCSRGECDLRDDGFHGGLPRHRQRGG